MPHPSHRLDLQLVPRGEGAAERVRQGLASLVERGVLTAEGLAGAEAGWLVDGGFARVRADAGDRPRLWANQQGGFRAACPSCGASVVRELQRAVRAEGAPVSCGICGWTGEIDAVAFRPAAAWGTSALVVHDAQSAWLTEAGGAWAGEVLGDFALVWRRP